MKPLLILFSIVMLASCAQQPTDQAVNPQSNSINNIKFSSHFFKSHDGLNIHYQMAGKGTPVLMLHGYYATGQLNWIDNGIAPTLASNYQVILMDARGHGKSEKPHDKKLYGPNMYKDAIALLDHLNIRKAHIHGYSMGGSMLTQILYHHPERVITAIYGGAGIPETLKAQIKKQKLDKQPSKMVVFQEKKLRMEIVKTHSQDHKALKIMATNAPWSGNESGKINLEKINIPILAIVGEYDTPIKRTSRMSREIKNFKKVILPGKGHLTAIVKGHLPPEYLQETLRFLQKN